MHQALCIDEIIRLIFDICANEGQSALGQLARCCKAWKDPALDNLWRHLPCAAPLLRLIPGVIEKEGVFTLGCPIDASELISFHSYAHRIKSITHRHRRPIDPLVLSLLQVAAASGNPHLLPNITTVQIGCTGWDGLTMPMGISRQLHHLTLDVGFNKARMNDRGRSNLAAAEEYLEQVARIATPHHLYLRGSALGSGRITCALNSMRSLCVLSLATGKSLTVNTLAAIATFPFLSELDIHAGHIDVDELTHAVASHKIPLFPALQKLHIRTHAPLVELLLQMISSNDLRDLNIEAEQPTQAPSSWSSVLSLIPAKASNTLLELRIEHHIDIDIDIDSNPNDTPTHSDSSGQFTLTTIRPLAQLSHLRRFTLDTIVPPDFCDADIEEMAKWWPHLQHLDLGGLLSVVDCLGQTWKLRTSISCLETLARGCPRLETLIINLDVTSSDLKNPRSTQVPQLPHHSLRHLTVGSIAAPNPFYWSQYLHRVFPSLVEIDGIHPHEEIWSTVQAMLCIPHLSSENLEQMALDRVEDTPQNGKEYGLSQS